MVHSGESASRPPFFDARTHEVDYVGPGREEPPPEGLTEVSIGWFGPTDPEAPLGGSMWCAATLAVEEANREGGLDGLPFRLLGRWSENPWGSGIKGLAELVYEERVWALLGAPDSASAHLVEQVVAKARIAFLSPVATDKTTNLVNVPWIFACAPGDPEIARALAPAIVKAAEGGRLALVSGTDHDSRQLTVELLSALGDAASFPDRHVQLRPERQDLGVFLAQVIAGDPKAVVVMAGARESARVVQALREGGLEAPVVLGPQAGRRAFAASLREDPGDIRIPFLWTLERSGKPGRAFDRKFRKEFGFAPDYAAAYTYDAARLLIQAVRDTGLNRVRIRDRIRSLEPWEGVTGSFEWNPAGRREGARITLVGPPPGRNP
jgi:branched-chain amino acid transport system substrate-binding protein